MIHIHLQYFCGLGWVRLVFEILLTLFHTDTHRLTQSVPLRNLCVFPCGASFTALNVFRCFLCITERNCGLLLYLDLSVSVAKHFVWQMCVVIIVSLLCVKYWCSSFNFLRSCLRYKISALLLNSFIFACLLPLMQHLQLTCRFYFVLFADWKCLQRSNPQPGFLLLLPLTHLSFFLFFLPVLVRHLSLLNWGMSQKHSPQNLFLSSPLSHLP